MKPFNPARKILEQIKDQQFILDKAISVGDKAAQKKAERNIKNLKKDFAKLSEDN